MPSILDYIQQEYEGLPLPTRAALKFPPLLPLVVLPPAMAAYERYVARPFRKKVFGTETFEEDIPRFDPSIRATGEPVRPFSPAQEFAREAWARTKTEATDPLNLLSLVGPAAKGVGKVGTIAGKIGPIGRATERMAPGVSRILKRIGPLGKYRTVTRGEETVLPAIEEMLGAQRGASSETNRIHKALSEFMGDVPDAPTALTRKLVEVAEGRAPLSDILAIEGADPGKATRAVEAMGIARERFPDLYMGYLRFARGVAKPQVPLRRILETPIAETAQPRAYKERTVEEIAALGPERLWKRAPLVTPKPGEVVGRLQAGYPASITPHEAKGLLRVYRRALKQEPRLGTFVDRMVVEDLDAPAALDRATGTLTIGRRHLGTLRAEDVAAVVGDIPVGETGRFSPTGYIPYLREPLREGERISRAARRMHPGLKVRAQHLERLMRRESLTAEGFYTERNPAYAIATALKQEGDDVARFEALARIGADDLIARRVPFAEEGAEEAIRALKAAGWVEVPKGGRGVAGERVFDWGALAGRQGELGLVAPDVWKVLQTTFQPQRGLPFFRFVEAVNRVWKVKQLLPRPATHFRNMMSDLGFLDLSGYAPELPSTTRLVARAAKELWQDMKAIRPSPLIREAERLGVIDSDWTSAFLMDDLLPILAKRAGPEKDAEVFTRMAQWIENHVLRSGAVREMGRIYRAPENAMKLATFMGEIENGLSPAQAAETVYRFWPVYWRVPGAVRTAEQSALGAPFLAWQYESARVLLNALRSRQGQGKLAKWALYSMASRKMTERMVRGTVSPEQLRGLEDDPRRVVVPAPFPPDKQGRVALLDLTYIWPFADQVLAAREPGEFFTQRVATNPFYTTIIDILYEKDRYTGAPIFREEDVAERGKPAILAGRFAEELLAPPLIMRDLPAVGRAAIGAPGARGLAETVLSEIGGMRTLRRGVPEARRALGFEIQREVRTTREALGRVRRQLKRGEITQADHDRKVAALRSGIQEKARSYRARVRRLGD